MTLRDQAICGQCRHRFRTGAAVDTQELPETQTAAPDPLHRTMEFTLPLLARRTSAPAELTPLPNAVATSRRIIFFALAVLTLCLAAALWHTHSRHAPEAVSPAGVWETTLHGKASSDAHLEFTFQAGGTDQKGGTGRFSWRESGPAALSGQTPLLWRKNTDGTLALTLTAPAAGDPVSQTLAGIFSSHPWPWRVDRAHRQLILGTLVFTEKS